MQNSVLPQDTGPEVKFNMSPFIMFDSMPVLVHGNNFGPCKRYRAPHAQTPQKQKKKRKILAFGPNIDKKKKYVRYLELGSINYTNHYENISSCYLNKHISPDNGKNVLHS